MTWFRDRNIQYVFYPEAYVHESPVFHARGLVELLEAWRADSNLFVVIQSMELKRPRAGGTELVEIWEVQSEQDENHVRP